MHTAPSHRGRTLHGVPPALCALLILPAGCGFATGGVTAAASSGGGSANAPSTPAGLLVLNPKTSPAKIRIVMTDAESDVAEVEFFFSAPGTGGAERRLSQVAENPIRLATSRGGTVHELTWDFASEAGIGTAALTKDVVLSARVRGGVDQSTAVALGNDAPTVAPDPITTEVSGVVPLSFFVADSSADITAIKVEFRIEGDPADAWRVARAAGLSPSEPTADIALANVEAIPTPGTRRLFFWDSAHDLEGIERDVTFRFTAFDPVAQGPSATMAPIRVDNNQQPIVQINDGALLASGDRRRMVSVPFTVFDAESDLVDVVMQWRRALDADFPPLGTNDPGELRRLLQDANYVRDKHICKPHFLAARGQGNLLDPLRLRTPDIATTQASVLPHGIQGRPIEFLRHVRAAPIDATTAWATNPLQRPVAILPIDSGVEALVLDDMQGSARLLRIDVTTGTVIQVLAAGLVGSPTAMTFSKRRSTVFVATVAVGGWLLHEVDLGTGQAVQRAAAPPSITTPTIRSVAAVLDRVVFATVESRLVRIDWVDPQSPRTVTLLDNLAAPSGIVLDPHDANRVFLAERDFVGGSVTGRVAAWSLDTRLPVAFLPVAQRPVRPTALALAPQGRRLFVLTEPVLGTRQVRRYELGVPSPGAAVAPMAVAPGTGQIATGEESVWMSVDPALRSIFVQGGATHRRIVTGYDPTTTVLTLDAPVTGLSGARPWRIVVAAGKAIRATPSGRTESMLWDTRAVAGLGPVALRAFAIDSEPGPSSAASTGVEMRLDGAVSQAMSGTVDLVADLNGDGAMDVKTGSSVQNQASPRTFATGPTVSSAASVSFDVNGDGRNDLVELGGQVRIWHQTGGGSFGATPTTTISLAANRVLDMDGDGRFDLAQLGVPTRVFYQLAGGTFTSAVTINNASATGEELADMNSDGLTDVLARASTFLQAPGRSFPATPSFIAPLSLGTGVPAANLTDAADVDGDGRMDIVISGQQPSTALAMQVLFQESPGVFAPPLTFDGFGAGFTYRSVSDIDGDGFLDIRGGFLLKQGPPRAFASGVVLVDATEVPDIDGDGAPDSFTGGDLRWRNVDGSYEESVSMGVGSSAFSLGDFDGDGLGDVGITVVGVGTTTPFALAMQIFAQQAGPSLSLEPGFNNQVFVGDMPALGVLQAPGDINQDGVTDVVCWVGDQNSGSRSVFHASLRESNATLIGGVGIQLGLQFGFSLADLVGDSGLDFVLPILDSIRLYPRQAGSYPTFQVWDPAPGDSARPCCFAAGDLNGDLKPDLVVGMDNQVRVVLQTTSGLTNVGATLPTGSSASTARVQVVDLDGDGIQDVLALQGGSVRVVYGTGPGTFSAGVSISGVVSDFRVTDVDADGDLDVLATDGQVVVLAQIGPREFVTSRKAGAASGGMDLHDVDNDGTADVGVSGPGGVRFIFGGR